VTILDGGDLTSIFQQKEWGALHDTKRHQIGNRPCRVSVIKYLVRIARYRDGVNDVRTVEFSKIVRLKRPIS
jgi:hypothetical protein